MALLKKQINNKKTAKVVGLSQSKVNRIMKKHFEIGGWDTIVEATREFKSASGVDVCIEQVMNVLRKQSLGSVEKVSKLALSIKNEKERLEFVKCIRIG
jgi:hypothetical protein